MKGVKHTKLLYCAALKHNNNIVLLDVCDIYLFIK